MAASRLKDLDQRLERFAAAVEAAGGDNLSSFVLYGSAAVGAAREDSDVNLLLILRDVRAAALAAVGPAVREWVKSGERPPLIFSEASWRAAADVFPLEIEDIRDRHRVLRGSNPVAGLETTHEDQRRELEREVRGRMIQLRAAYAAAAPDGKALGDLVVQSCRGLLPLFRAALRVAGAEAPAEPAEIVRRLGDLANLDATGFEWPLGRLAGARLRSLEPHDSRASRYLDAVGDFVDYVDRALLQETP